MNYRETNDWLENTFLRDRRPYFWIALVIFVVFLPTLFYGIVYLDDNVLVVRDYPFNRDLSNIFASFREDIFRSPQGTGTFYRPIERLTFILDAQFGQGAIVFMSHLSNLLLHIFAIWLLLRLLLKLKINRSAALIFCLLFATHPLTAQTVSFISGRNDSLLAIIIFPSILFFLDYLDTLKRKYYYWHLFFFLLALFTKETAVILPLILMTYVFIFRGYKKIWDNLKFYFILAAGWAGSLIFWFVIRRSVIGDLIGNADYNIGLSIYRNFPALLPAIGKIMLPFDLSVFPILENMTFLYGILSLLILISWYVLSQNKNHRWIIFGAAWFFLFIFLTLIKPEGAAADFSENRIYIPMFGFIFIFWGLGPIRFLNFAEHKKKYLVLGAIILVIFSSVTIYRNRYYKNQFNFWHNAVATSPDFAFNHNNLGAMYFLDGNLSEAEKEFRRAINLNPNEKMAHNNLGLVLASLNKPEEAEAEYKKEIEINPYYDNAHFNLGLLYFKAEKIDKAQEHWETALMSNPNHTDALFNLTSLYYSQKEYKKAAVLASRLSQLGFDLPPEFKQLLSPLNFLQLNSQNVR